MNKSGIPYLDFAWNPCGFGCSHGCPTCWARRQVIGPARPKCPDCRKFKVHFHPERLTGKLSPASRKKSAVVGVQFTGDLFDPQRPLEQTLKVLDACFAAPQHVFVFLTRQYQNAWETLEGWMHKCVVSPDGPYSPADQWYIGTTCQTQEDYDKAAYYFSDSRWLWWISGEPLNGPITPLGRYTNPCGIILGADNQPNEPFDIEWHCKTSEVFSAIGSKVYMKQLWVPTCLTCKRINHYNAAGRCGTCGGPMARKLHRETENFPDRAELHHRELPWTLTTKAKED